MRTIPEEGGEWEGRVGVPSTEDRETSHIRIQPHERKGFAVCDSGDDGIFRHFPKELAREKSFLQKGIS